MYDVVLVLACPCVHRWGLLSLGAYLLLAVSLSGQSVLPGFIFWSVNGLRCCQIWSGQIRRLGHLWCGRMFSIFEINW